MANYNHLLKPKNNGVKPVKHSHVHGIENSSSKVTEITTHPDIDQVLVRFETIFQVPNTLPPHRSVDHRIYMYPTTKPVNVGPYRYPHYQKGEMESEMLSQGIIRVSHSPFLLPELLVKKKDGSYRFCVDYRALNEVTVKDKLPIPTADEMFDELGVLGSLPILIYQQDTTKRVHDRDIYKTAFRTHNEHYEFLVMSLDSQTRTFQATMNQLFSPYLR